MKLKLKIVLRVAEALFNFCQYFSAAVFGIIFLIEAIGILGYTATLTWFYARQATQSPWVTFTAGIFAACAATSLLYKKTNPKWHAWAGTVAIALVATELVNRMFDGLFLAPIKGNHSTGPEDILLAVLFCSLTAAVSCTWPALRAEPALSIFEHKVTT